MVAELKTGIKYNHAFIASQKDPLIVLNSFLQAGIFTKYVMYEGKDEVRIAGGELATVLVTPERVLLAGMGKTISEAVSNPLKQLEKILDSLQLKDWTAYGYVGFDLVRFYSAYSKAISQPLCQFLIPETELHFNREGVKIKTTKSIELVKQILSNDTQLPNYEPTSLEVDRSQQSDYQQSVSTLIEAIKEEHLHKAIISRSFKLDGALDILGTYKLAAQANNSARSYCLDLGDVRAVGFSPETLIEVDETGFVTTNPLAGTRHRGVDAEEDLQLHNELFTDAKEVKEHSLSVWLAQSEIASVCLPETVHIYNFMEVKKYRCVQHLSSRVGGQLKPDHSFWDALIVLFPGITVSGINKEKAIEWIDRLEEEPRGIYAGGIGWVNSRGQADIAIAIRSAYQYGDRVYLNAGAGIIAESVPQNEYIESENKMNTMLNNLVLESRT